MSDARIGIVIDPSGAVTGARTVRRSLDDIGGGARSALSAVQMLTGALASIGVGLGLRDALQTIGSFQESLSGVQAVTRATANEMKAMEREARRLGATTRYTAGQAAEGMRFLGMAGFETSNIIKAMPAVLNLATAATMDLGRAADITSNIMSAFGIEAEETARIADALAMAASSANTDVAQLGDAMKYVGPVAAAFNVSMEDAAAATATLSNAGIQGTMAGTGLRRVFSSLANPTKEAQRSIESLGLTMAEVNPLTNDLVDIIEALADAGLDAERALTIFGDRGGPAILALTSQVSDLRRLTEAINDSAGAAEEMAATMADNIPGALRNLASAIEESVHQMGDRGLAGAFRELIDTATNVVRIWNGMGDTIEEHIEYYERMARTVEVLAYAIGTTLAARAIPAATAALYSMATAMAMTPIGAFSLALGGLVAAYTLLRGEIQETQTVEEEHQSALDRLKQIRGELTTATDEQAQALRDERQAIIDNTRAELESLKVLLAKERATQGMRVVQPDFDEGARIAETESWIAQTEQRLNELEAAARRVAGGLRDALGTAIATAVAEGLESLEQVKVLLKELPRSRSGGGGGSGRDIAAEFRAQRDSLLETNDALQDVIAAYGESEQAVAKAQKALELLSATQGISKDFSEEQRAALVALMRDQQDYVDQIEGLRRIQDLDGQLELLQAELSLVGETKAVREEALAVLEAEIRLKQRGVDLTSQQAQEEIKRVRQMAQTRRAIDEQTRSLAEQERAFQSLVNDTVRYGSDLFADLFRETSGGWRGMWENMRQTMISALARMAAEAALRPIVVSVLGAMGVAGAGAAAGAAGIGGAGGGGGILGSLFGMGQQAASLADGGMFSSGIFAEGGALAGVGSFMSKPLFMVPTGAIEAGTGAMAMAPGISLGGVLGAAGLGFMGGGMLAQLTGGNQMGGSIGGAGGAALGATIGSAVPGIGTVLGGIVGGLLGGGIGSLFGGGDDDQEIRPISYAPSSGRGRQTPLRGIELDTTRYKGGGAFKDAVQQADEAIAQYLSDRMVEQVRDFLDERGTIRGKKRDNKEIGEKHIRRALREMYNPIIEALGGTEAAKAFSDMTSSAKPEKVLETAVEIAAFLGRLNDETLFRPQEISQLEAAWKALNTQIDDATEMAEQLGQSLEEVARQGEEARQAFHDEIQQGYQDQIDAMLRPAEFAWRQLREAQAKEIEELEKVEASTAKARQWHQLQIRALFEQNYELQRMHLEGLIDLGEDLNAQIGALWGIVSTGIGGLVADSNAAYQEAVRLGRQYAQINRNLRQTIVGLRTGPQSPLSLEQQLMEALDRFRQTLGEALGGDSEAAQQLQQLVNPVLELASQFFGRTEGYAQIFDEVLRGLEMAGVAMETQAGGFAALASALDAQIGILNEINDVLNRRDELGEDFESRYNKLTSELEDVGYTIGGINAFLRDAADAIPTTIVTAFASGLDSAQLAKRMGELFQATVTATEQAMRDGVEDIGAAIDGAQQALLRGWIPDFIELAEQFNGAIPEIRFDRVTARVVAHYEASADQLGEGLESAVAQVAFDGLERSIYVAQQLVGTRFDAAVGGISFEGIDGEYLAATLYDGITGVAEAVQVVLDGQATRISGVIRRTLRSFTLDAAQATITDSVDIINNGATSVQLAFGRVEGALLRLSNNADGHIVALIDEVDTAISRFTNWGAGSLRVGVESLRAGLLDVRNAGEGALELWADTVEARETRISNLGPGALAARINSLRGQLVNVRNSGAGLLEFWADTVESRATVIENIDRGNLRAVINDLRGGIVTVRNLSRGHLQFWANRVEADTVRIENIDRGDLRAIVNDLRAGILTIRNRAAGHLEFWADLVEAGETRIENVGRGDLMAFVTTLRSGLVSVRNLSAGHLRFWANRVEAGETRIENIDRGDLNAAIGTLRSALVTIRNLGAGRLEFWAETIKAQETRLENLNAGTLVARINNLRSDLLTIRNAGQGRLSFWADTVEAREAQISNLDAGNLVARINDLRAGLLNIRNAGQGRLLFWADRVEAREASIRNLDAGNLVARIQDLRAELLAIRNAGQGRLNFWAETVEAREASILNIGGGVLTTAANSFRAKLLTIRNLGQGRLDFWTGRLEAREDAISGLDAGNLVAKANDLRARLTNVRNVSQNKLGDWRNRVNNHLERIRDIDAGNIGPNANDLRSSLASTRTTAQQRLGAWATRVKQELNRIADLSTDLGGGNIAAELKKIVENRLPQRFKEAIDRAFGNVFDTAKPTEFFKNMDKLVGANSELVKNLRELSRTMLLLARKDQIDAFAASIGERASNAMRVPSLAGARGKLNADQGWENQGHSYARINYSASKGFTMGSTHKSGGSGSSQLNKMKSRAQELMDQLNHLVSVNRIAIDPSKLPSTMELNSRKGKASAQEIFDDLIKRGAVVARVDDPKDNMLDRMANEMRRLVGGTLPKYGANYRVKNGKLEMDLWAGDRSLTRTGSALTDLNDIAGQFLQMLKHEIKVSSAIEPLLKAIDFRPAGLGPQGGLEQLARSLMEHGLGTGNVPKFATGGYHAGGLAIVGERGRELVDFASPARIYSASDTSRIMAGFANDNGSFRELIAEVRALRAENAELRRTVSEGFGDTVQAEGQSGLALRAELRGLREDVEDLQATMRQQERRRAS